VKRLLSRNFVRYQLPAILVALAIFVLSSIPDLHIPSLHWKFKDKWAHLIAYTVLGFLTCRALYYQRKYYALQVHPLIWAFLLVTLYGISDEFHQAFVPGRTPDVFDVAADCVGAILGLVFFLLARFFQKRPAEILDNSE